MDCDEQMVHQDNGLQTQEIVDKPDDQVPVAQYFHKMTISEEPRESQPIPRDTGISQLTIQPVPHDISELFKKLLHAGPQNQK